MTQAGVVSLVGAGPGDPGLLTARAIECLRRADLVVYDKLVPVAFLALAPASAQRICVTELAPDHGDRYANIPATLIAAARSGLRVVRLKGGDPFLFGRGGEEAEALVAAGIAYEVVPGVTAALAAAACAGMPLTHRAVASAVAFVTGHEQPEKLAGLDWQALASFPGTLVVYMGLARIGEITARLIAHGKPADTPTAVVSHASTGAQRTTTATLSTIAAAVCADGLTAPAVTIIGPVVELRQQLAWLERRPLFGQRVLIARPRHQAADLIQQLADLGAVPLLLPTVEIGPPADWSPVDAAIAELKSYDWLVFTSVNGVQAFLGRLLERGGDVRALGHLQLAAIGPSTAEALRAYHLRADLVPTQFRSEQLAAELKAQVAGKRVLLARADRGREILRDELAAVAEVRQVAVYSQVDAVTADAGIVASLARGEVDCVLLTSSNIARALARLVDAEGVAHLRSGRTRVVSISPVTSAAVAELGWPVAAEAREYTIAGMLKALAEMVEEARRGD